ncbi:hypothetical protein PE066_02415 [Ramlibacter tataouinensis]|uniref:hypothetical protein n=1 Tax=Ramlibacter tataouinensis TaxID=94132 RepID=UPI0022F39C24|nr:hypothetical protein [Ramlibacter tataouinensis]WBY02408.1 hypothetical protein PE066_02415 [Ramlibacter tataouinensis]
MLYHTDTHGPSESGFKAGIMKAAAEAQANGTNEVLLLAHTLDNLKGVVAAVLGDDFVAALAKHKQVVVGPVTIHLETERIRSAFVKGVIFAPFVSSKLLETAIKDHRGTDIVYVPWAESELLTFVEAHPESTVL